MDTRLTRALIDTSGRRGAALVPRGTPVAVVAAIFFGFTLLDVLEPAYVSACVAAAVAVAWAAFLDRQPDHVLHGDARGEG